MFENSEGLRKKSTLLPQFNAFVAALDAGLRQYDFVQDKSFIESIYLKLAAMKNSKLTDVVRKKKSSISVTFPINPDYPFSFSDNAIIPEKDSDAIATFYDQMTRIITLNAIDKTTTSMDDPGIYYVQASMLPADPTIFLKEHGDNFVFIDEVQMCENFEKAVNGLHASEKYDIYITGSNAYLLSSEYATYLSGRCVEIKMLPLSFSEFLHFHDFEVKTGKSALGGIRTQVFDQQGERYELREVFDAYMRFGGMPGIADVGLDQEKAMVLLDGIYSTVVVRDILEREKRRGQKQITDPVLLRKIILFLADNIGSTVSVSSIGNTLVNEGLLEDGKRKGIPSTHTVQAYISALMESYFFYDIKRFDIKSKEY